MKELVIFLQDEEVTVFEKQEGDWINFTLKGEQTLLGDLDGAIKTVNDNIGRSDNLKLVKIHLVVVSDDFNQLPSGIQRLESLESNDHQTYLPEKYSSHFNKNDSIDDWLQGFIKIQNELMRTQLTESLNDEQQVQKALELIKSKDDQDIKNAVLILEELAKVDNALALYELGELFYNGIFYDQDFSKAFDLFLKSAEKGNAEAQYSCAWFYYHGEGVDEDYPLAVQWCKKAVTKEYKHAYRLLARMYFNGDGVEEDEKKSLSLYQKAFDLGDIESAMYIGFAYCYGWGTDINHEKAFEFFKKAEELADEEDFFLMGNAYKIISKRPPDKYKEKARLKSLDCYKKSSDMGYADASYALFYDMSQGKEFLLKAAEQGHREACFRLGAYEENDLEKSFFWLLKASEADDGRACTEVANRYYLGKGCKRSATEAFKWFKKGTDFLAGNFAGKKYLIECVFMLAKAYEFGDGVQQDLNKAITLYSGLVLPDTFVYIDSNYYFNDLERCYDKAGFEWPREIYEKYIDSDYQNVLASAGQIEASNQPDYSVAIKILQNNLTWNQLDNKHAYWGLGYAYWTGRGVGEDLKSAALYLERAAAYGHSKAQYILGVVILMMTPDGEDLAPQEFWLRQSILIDPISVVSEHAVDDLKSDFEYSDSEIKALIDGFIVNEEADKAFEIGISFFEGRQGYHKSVEKSLFWFSKAAESGHVYAQFMCAEIFRGYARFKDSNKAFYWYQEAADQGHAASLYQLSQYYEEGLLPVESNQSVAFEYLNQAAAKSYQAAIEELSKSKYQAFK